MVFEQSILVIPPQIRQVKVLCMSRVCGCVSTPSLYVLDYFGDSILKDFSAGQKRLGAVASLIW